MPGLMPPIRSLRLIASAGMEVTYIRASIAGWPAVFTL